MGAKHSDTQFRQWADHSDRSERWRARSTRSRTCSPTRRWQLVSTHQKLLCWVHDQLLQLLPGGAPTALSPNKIAKLLRRIPTCSGDPVADQRRQVVVDLLAELRRHHTAIKQVNRQPTTRCSSTAR